MKFNIRKIKGMFRVTFPDAPFYNTNRSSRFEAEQYASKVNAGIESSKRNPIPWPNNPIPLPHSLPMGLRVGDGLDQPLIQ